MEINIEIMKMLKIFHIFQCNLNYVYNWYCKKIQKRPTINELMLDSFFMGDEISIHTCSYLKDDTLIPIQITFSAKCTYFSVDPTSILLLFPQILPVNIPKVPSWHFVHSDLNA